MDEEHAKGLDLVVSDEDFHLNEQKKNISSFIHSKMKRSVNFTNFLNQTKVYYFNFTNW